MNDLPKVYQNEINHKINNEQEIFVSSKKEMVNNKNINLKDIDLILNDRNHISKAKVKITLKNGKTISKYLISRDNNNLIFMDNTKLPISDISDIFVE